MTRAIAKVRSVSKKCLVGWKQVMSHVRPCGNEQMSSKAASQVATGTAGRSASVDRKTRNGPGHAQPETTAFKEHDEEVTDGKN